MRHDNKLPILLPSPLYFWLGMISGTLIAIMFELAEINAHLQTLVSR